MCLPSGGGDKVLLLTEGSTSGFGSLNPHTDHQGMGLFPQLDRGIGGETEAHRIPSICSSGTAVGLRLLRVRALSSGSGSEVICPGGGTGDSLGVLKSTSEEG